MSLLEIVESVDNFSYDGELNENVYVLRSHTLQNLGFVLKHFITELEKYVKVDEFFLIDHVTRSITISSNLDTLDKRTTAFAEIGKYFRDLGKYDLLKGWRNEQYTVYSPSHTPYIHIERSFCPVWGVVMYGIHINGYIPAELSIDGQIKLWIPRRSPTKQTFPGMLDNTVAGGIGYPYGVLKTVIKESNEEAGLDEAYVKANLTEVGVVSYIFSNEKGNYHDENGSIQPELQHCFDLKFDKDIIPVPNDNEVEKFELMSLDTVLKALHNGEFKPNCALILIDFLIRHGYINSQNEPAYSEIVQRLHRRLPFALK